MEPSERFNLRWDGFGTNVRGAMKEFQKESEFFDVTLVAGDGEQIRANKIVLAGASKFFHKVIKENPHPHPLIYLKGVTTKNLLYLLDYMYTGEVDIFNNDVGDFLNTAEHLKVKGLDASQDQTNANQTNTRPSHSPIHHQETVSVGESSSSHHESDTSSRSQDTMDKPALSVTHPIPKPALSVTHPIPKPTLSVKNPILKTMNKPVQNPQVMPAPHQNRLPLLIASATSSSTSNNNIFLQAPCQKDREDGTVKVEFFDEDTNVKVEVVDETAAPMETDNAAEVAEDYFQQAPNWIDPDEDDNGKISAGKWENSFGPENMDSVDAFGDGYYDEGETYEQKDHFKMNMKRHKGEEPYHCSRCPKSFSEMQHLEMHMDRKKKCSQTL